MIDILMATYNGENYIKEQIDSIIAQTYNNWRLIIHDDQSVDRTVSIAKAAALDLSQETGTGYVGKQQILVTVNTQPCKGAAANFLGLLKAASSDYAMFCDQDDVWNPDKIEKTLRYMKKMEKKYGKDIPMLVYTDLSVVDAHLQVLAPSFLAYMNLPPKLELPRLLFQNSVTGCTVLMNRALCRLLQKAGDTKYIVMHDHFAALTAVALGKAFLLPEATIQYRQHGDNSVGASDAKSAAYLWKRYRQGKKKFRKDLYRTMIQAGYFLQLFQDEIKDERVKLLLKQYSHLYCRKKVPRVIFYIKNRIIKYGWLRAVMQMVWG